MEADVLPIRPTSVIRLPDEPARVILLLRERLGIKAARLQQRSSPSGAAATAAQASGLCQPDFNGRWKRSRSRSPDHLTKRSRWDHDYDP